MFYSSLHLTNPPTCIFTCLMYHIWIGNIKQTNGLKLNEPVDPSFTTAHIGFSHYLFTEMNRCVEIILLFGLHLSTLENMCEM